MLQVLFELARYHAPSTIFLDELESVMGQRGVGPGYGVFLCIIITDNCVYKTLVMRFVKFTCA